MDEKDLINYWNQKRSQIISSQLGATIFLSVLIMGSIYKDLNTLDSKTKYLIAIIAAITGLLAISGQTFIIREGHATVVSLKKLSQMSPLAKSIADMERYVIWSGVFINALALGAFWILLVKLFG
jgi:hypothetical protein